MTYSFSVEGKREMHKAMGLKVFVHLLKTYTTPQVLGPVLMILSNISSEGSLTDSQPANCETHTHSERKC